MPIYRVDFHHHVKGDPMDLLGYTVKDLIDSAVERGIDALAITPHGKVFCDSEAESYARSRGVLLIPGVEKRISGKEALILNVTPDEIPTPMSFEDLRMLREKRGDSILVVAPHPFYPSSACLLEKLEVYRDLFDAVEYAHLHLPFYNPNDEAVEWARKRKKPLLANSDTHSLFMFGRNYTEVEATELNIKNIFESIRAHRTTPHIHIPSHWEVGRFLFEVTFFQWIYRQILPSRRRVLQLNRTGNI